MEGFIENLVFGSRQGSSSDKELNVLPTIDNCVWPIHGKNIDFEIHAAGTPFRPIQGVYIMAKRVGFYWNAIYVGETENLDARVGKGLKFHEHWSDAARLGATHIHVLQTFGNRQLRLDIESALRAEYNPPCNMQ